MLVLLAVGIHAFGLGGHRLKCQIRRSVPYSWLCCPLDEKKCLLPSVLLLIMIYHIYDRSFLREKVEEV